MRCFNTTGSVDSAILYRLLPLSATAGAAQPKRVSADRAVAVFHAARASANGQTPRTELGMAKPKIVLARKWPHKN